eukprot:TRINITY_DN9116_c0_g1_i6.p1 TRINITY_DN9116_c0_g1~~TRINITY_DN9116_c0_g1_i6.p1  ORF type:complete len:747 (+),score=157.25 TRINITY_DN9116_c0_g1_i6:161-2401(+)
MCIRDRDWTPPPIGGTRTSGADGPSATPLNLHGAKVLVTGGAGFVGHNLIRKLVNEYKADVRVVDNLWRGKLSNLEGLIDLKTKFVQADLTDPVMCRRVVKDVDIVFHLADVVAGVDFVFAHQPFVFRQNMLINTNVLGACVSNKIHNYVYVGTACSFPQHLQMVERGEVALHEDQTYPAEPESSYGWSKLMGEYEAALAQASGVINVGLLRLHNVYGPGSPWHPERSQALPSLIRKAIMHPKEGFSVWGSGEQYRDFLHVRDVCDALCLLVERGMNQGVMQVGLGVAVRLKEAAQVVAGLAKELMNKDVTPEFDRSKPEGDRGRIAITTRSEAILGWKPQISFREGMKETFKWVLADMEAEKAAAAPPLPFIPQMAPWFDQAEADAMHEYMGSGGYLTEFRATKQFENMLAEYIGVKHCVAVNNGTISLSLALRALGVGPGDRVLVPDWTMVATANSCQLLGAQPVFVDVEPETCCISIERVRAILEDSAQRPAAVMHVSMNARSNDIEALVALCAQYNVPLIEDSAQALGSFHRCADGSSKHLGTFGQIGSFSFSSPKIISTGQGGALVTNDDGLAASLRKLKDFGRASGGNDTHDSIGWNFKYTDLQGVVGVEQMKKLPFRVQRMRAIWDLYYSELSSIPQVKMNSHHTVQPGWIPWFVDIYTRDRDQLAKYLKQHAAVGTRNVYPPIHTQQAYSAHNAESYPVTEGLASEGLWLPSSSKLTDEEVLRVCAAIKRFYQPRAKL